MLPISSEWHMRRVLLTMRATFPPGIRFICCPTPEGCTRDNWTTSEECRQEVLQELELFLEFRGAELPGPG